MNTINETEKVLAAMDVSDSGILTGKQKFSDVQRVKAILPDHYEVKESRPTAIHCISNVGINKDGEEDEEHWQYIMQAFQKYFGNRLSEVYHNTCFCHKDFTIYLRKNLQAAPSAQ